MNIGPAFFGNIGMQELLVILLICVIIFGANRIPEIARSLGKSVREFKRGMKENEPGKEGPDENKRDKPAD